jgi:hypothetical protein
VKAKKQSELVELIISALRPVIREEIQSVLDEQDYELARLRRATPRDSNVWAVRNEYGEIEFIKRGGTGTLG